MGEESGGMTMDEELKKYLEGMEERLIERTRDMQKEVLRPMLDAAVSPSAPTFRICAARWAGASI